MQAVEDAFIDKFGPWAGWAHNTLFISELATQQQHLPEHLRAKGAAKSSKSKKAVKAASLATVPKDDNGLQGTSTANPDAAAGPGPKKRRRSNDTSGLLQHTEEDEIKPVSKKRKVASKAETQLEDKDADEQRMAAVGTGSTAELTDEQALSPAADQAPPRQVQLQQRRIASKQAGRRTRSSAAAALTAMDQVASAASVTLH